MRVQELRDEKGMALVITLIVLFLMTVLGAMLFTNSNSELQASRNFRTAQEAMHAAERAVEYAKSDPAIYTTIGTGSVAVPVSGVDLSSGGSDASGTVTYLSRGNPPRGSGMDATEFEANYFAINVNGTGPFNAQAEVEVNVAKIVPKN